MTATENLDPATPLADKRMVSTGDVLRALNCSDRTLAKLITNGKFPRPLMVGSGRRWFLADVLAWIDSRDAERKAAGK